MTIDLDALEKLADEATPGPWEPVSLSGYGNPFSIRMAYQSDNPNASKTHYGIQSVRTRGDAHFIAAANPATVLALIAEIAALRAGCAKSNDEISQALGKALGYPWFKDDRINFPGATDEHGVCVGDHVAESLADEAARRITEAERKLAEARTIIDEGLYARTDKFEAMARAFLARNGKGEGS